ncbi:unnamed protein product, partial [Musa acuminata subsp. burmannicoides]
MKIEGTSCANLVSRVSHFRVLSTKQSNSSSGSGRWSPCWSFLRIESLPSTLHLFAPIKQKERKGHHQAQAASLAFPSLSAVSSPFPADPRSLFCSRARRPSLREELVRG